MEADGIRPDLWLCFPFRFDKVGYSSQNCLASTTYLSGCSPPADPDLHIGEGGSHPDPEIKGDSLQKNFFRPFGLQFDLKIREAGLPPASPLHPPPLPVQLRGLDWEAASLRIKGGGSGEGETKSTALAY